MGLDILVNQRAYLLTKEQKYLDSAIRRFAYFTNNLTLISPEGLIYDGTHTGKDISFDTWSYNQGVYIKIYESFYKILNDTTYLDKALKLAFASMKELSDPKSGILAEAYRTYPPLPTEDVNRDPMTFKGVYIRYLGELALTCAATEGT